MTENLKLGNYYIRTILILHGPNELLEDVRNFHNFRSQYDEYITGIKTIGGQPSVFTPRITGSGTSPSKSFYMSAGDFFFSEKIQFNSSTNVAREVAVDQSQVQPIILNEFQPDTIVYNTALYIQGFERVLNVAKHLPRCERNIEGG